MDPWGAVSFNLFGFYNPNSSYDSSKSRKSSLQNLSSSSSQTEDSWYILDELWTELAKKGLIQQIPTDLKLRIREELCYKEGEEEIPK